MDVRCFALRPYRWEEQDVADEGLWSETDTSEEPMGTKEKHWVKDQQQFSWLFKQARSRKNETLGEDWCECLVHGLACLIGVPSACVTPAICKGNRGLVSRSFKKPGERLEHGNELLSRVIPDYQLDTERENQLYCPLNVFKTLEGISSPIPMDGFSAYDVWSSYLLLDAWVAGRDRHHQNWGFCDAAKMRLGLLHPSTMAMHLASKFQRENWPSILIEAWNLGVGADAAIIFRANQC